jgi:hypothetical protein
LHYPSNFSWCPPHPPVTNIINNIDIHGRIVSSQSSRSAPSWQNHCYWRCQNQFPNTGSNTSIQTNNLNMANTKLWYHGWIAVVIQAAVNVTITIRMDVLWFEFAGMTKALWLHGRSVCFHSCYPHRFQGSLFSSNFYAIMFRDVIC